MELYGSYSTTEGKSKGEEFSEYEVRLMNTVNELVTESKNADPKGKEYMGTTMRHLTEDESINNIGASVAYAFNKNAEEWNTISLTTWVSDVIFAPFYIEMPKDLKKKEMKGFGVKETDPAFIHIRANSPFEFDADKSPIIVADWTGNFKKGIFNLNPTWVSKVKGPSVGQVLGAAFTYGATLVNSFKEEFYKTTVSFDGDDADWGKMTYVQGISMTQQTK